MNAVYVPQNKGIRFTKPYQKESFDPASVGVPNHLIPEDQKTLVDYVPFSPCDIESTDKPVPITDYPLTSTSVNFLRGHLPLTRTNNRRRKQSLSSSESELDLSAAESSEDEDSVNPNDYVEAELLPTTPDRTPPPDDLDDHTRRPRRHRSVGDTPTGNQDSRGRDSRLRRISRRDYTENPEEESGSRSAQFRRRARLGQSLDRYHTGTAQVHAPSAAQPALVNAPYTARVEGTRSGFEPTIPPPSNPYVCVDQYGVDLSPALARNFQTEEESAPLLQPQAKPKKKRDYLARFHPRRYETRSTAEKRQREGTDDVWASASAPPEESEEHAHTYNTRYQAQKRKK